MKGASEDSVASVLKKMSLAVRREATSGGGAVYE
jgi:hypothetical protein